MSNYREDRSQSSAFSNGTDHQDRRASQEDRTPHIPHDQLVRRFQSFIAQKQEDNRRHGFSTSPALIIRSELDWQSLQSQQDQQTSFQAFDFWQPLISAWDALAYDRYEPNSFEWIGATSRLSGKPVIQLTRYQGGIIDAMTEAAGIPHKKGQTAIQIPESAKANSKGVQESMQNTWLQMCMGERRKK